MALPPIPMISPLPEPPIRGVDTGVDFSNKTALFLDAMHDDLQPEINATASGINALLPTIEAGAEAADDAEAARDLAQGYANSADLDRIAAETARTGAETAQGLSEDARDLSEQYRDEAETARDVAIGAGPLPAQAGNAGKVLFTDGTNAFWDIARFTQLATTTTGGVAQWNFTSIPQIYSHLYLAILLTPSAGANLQLAVDMGGGFTSNMIIGGVTSAQATRAGIFIPGYMLGGGPVLANVRPAAAGVNAGSAMTEKGWSGGAISGLRVSLSAGTGSSVSIQLYGG